MGRKLCSKKKKYQGTDDDLLAQLRHKKFFPMLTADGITYSDTPPFTHKSVAQERAKQIASHGWSSIAIPTGYTKSEKPSWAALSALKLAQNAVAEQDNLLHGLSIRIYHTTKHAEKLLEENDSAAAAANM